MVKERMEKPDAFPSGEAVEDGQRLVVPLRDLGTTEVYPQSLQHSPNGR